MADKCNKHATLFTGAAGEHLVSAHLLRHDFNPQLVSVDTGIDIVAQKNNEIFHFQVKTTKARMAKFSFSASKLEKLWKENKVEGQIFIVDIQFVNDKDLTLLNILSNSVCQKNEFY